MTSTAEHGPTPPPPPRALVESYASARYRVTTPSGAFELHIGAPSPACDGWLAAEGAVTATVLTAWNPLSERRDDALNRQAQQRLEERVRALGRAAVPASNSDPGGRWPDEPSICVLDLPAADLASLLRDFSQYAAVLIARGEHARLVWHPGLSRAD